jgi:fructose-specific component phosphotransferase system IIB-like protein
MTASLTATMENTTPRTSGGAHTSRTMMLSELRNLLDACPGTAEPRDYERAVLDENVLGKASSSSRQRSFRYLRELYGLYLGLPSFRALRQLWDHDVDAQPLIALTSALTRDPALRGTAVAVLQASEGAMVSSDQLAAAVCDAYPGSYSRAVADKIGRNAASTWTQSGHLKGRTPKIRTRATPRPASVAYALFVESLTGAQGDLLFESLLLRVQDAPAYALHELAREASRRGWLDYRSIGTVTELGFDRLAGQELRA